MSAGQQDAFDQTFTSSRVVRAWEPPEEVVIPYALATSPDLDFDDYGVLIRLLIRNPNQPSSVLGLLEEFRAGGWTLSERDLRKIMRRLKKAGHVEHKREYNPETKRPEWTFRVYRNPANNAAYVRGGVQEALQVRPIGTPCPDRSPEGASDRDTLSGYAGQADRDTLSGSEASPPHPPEEVTTSSPYPHTDGARQHPSQTEEGEGDRFAQEDLTAAAKLLQLLPDPWTQGRPNARRLAPLLLAVMAEQEWPPIGEVNRKLLVAQLTRNPGKMTNPFRMLQKERIPNLPLYEAVTRTTVPQPSGAPDTPAEIECDKGCDRGYIEIDDRVAPCDCLPQRQAAAI